MTYSHEVERMCPLTKGPNHGPAPIPEEGQWVKAYQISDISGLTHGVGWCAPQQGTCKLTLNVKKGVMEALNTDLVCDAINVAMRELFLQIVYGRSQTAFSDDGLPVGAGLEDLGKGLRSMTGTIFSTKAKGVRYLELTEGYITKVAVDENGEQNDGGHPPRCGPEDRLREEHRHLRPLCGRAEVYRPARRVREEEKNNG